MKTYKIISMAGLGAVALLSIMIKDSLGFILCAALMILLNLITFIT